MRIDILTVFPVMLDGFIRESMLKRAVSMGRVALHTVDLRDYTEDVHRTTDDRPYGGGPGMVMKVEPILSAVEAIRTEQSRVILMSPQGQVFRQSVARELATESHLILICGHYEGIDERVRLLLQAEELSIGDYILTNGVLPAAVVVDAVVRLLPGVLGGEGATDEESFSDGLLEYPQYTRPVEYRGLRVPDVLRSGNHAAVRAWRKEQAEARTRERRKDLLQ